MEVLFLPYLLLLPLLPLSLYLLPIISKKGSNFRKSLPPGFKGWPLLGENVEYAMQGAQQFIRNRMEKYSPDVFRTSLFGEKMAVICGAQGNKFIFTNENKLVTAWVPQSLKKALTFPFDKSFDKRLRNVSAPRRNFHSDILKPEALRQYIPLMDDMAGRLLDREWNLNSVVKICRLAEKYTFSLTCKLFLNVVDPVIVNRWLDLFIVVQNGTFSVPIDLPGTAFNGAKNAGWKMRKELVMVIKERRKELLNGKTEGGDLLSKMAMATDEEGQYMSEMEICNSVIGLLVGSFEATSSAVSLVSYHLAELPHIYDEVLKEQMAIAKSKGPGELLTWEDVEKMKYSWNFAREAFRITPPGQGSFRETVEEFTYAGFTIPKGWKIFWTGHASHMNPEYFPDPEKFDPSRFEGAGPPPYTFIPFGGGPRMCPGREYARVLVLVFIHKLVTRFRLEKTIPKEKIAFYAAAMPADGLPLRLHPHQI